MDVRSGRRCCEEVHETTDGRGHGLDELWRRYHGGGDGFSKALSCNNRGFEEQTTDGRGHGLDELWRRYHGGGDGFSKALSCNNRGFEEQRAAAPDSPETKI